MDSLLVTVVGGLLFCGWDASDGFEKPPVVEPVHVFEGGVRDTWSRCFHGASLRMSSVLYRPMRDSARALLYESATEPTDGSMSASVSRFV